MSALLDAMQASFQSLPATALAADGEVRREALRLALADGLPSQRTEAWKYTALRALSARSFVSQAQTPRIHPAALADLPEPRIVFVNGSFDAALSSLGGLPDGLELRAASSAAGDDVASAKARMLASFDDAATSSPPIANAGQPAEFFARLNTALATDGVLLNLAPGVRVPAPVHMVHVGAPADGDIASHSAGSIVLGANSSLSLVEHHLATGPNRHLVNHVLRVRLGAGASLVHARLQDEDAGATLVARTDATLATDALYKRVDLELGAGLSRHELNVRLQGTGARLQSSGALLAGGRRHVDTRLGIVHESGDTQCDLLWRGLAAERGRVVFHGGIDILAGADGSDARLSNKNLLLSDSAEIDTQPVLQIHADEVKAAHGATVGQLDPTSLFYLRSRGIPLAQARVLLTLAFCREALSSLGDAMLIELLSPTLEARLAQLETVA